MITDDVRLSGQLPFVGDEQKSLEDRIQEGVLTFPDKPWATIDPSAKVACRDQTGHSDERLQLHLSLTLHFSD